MEALEGACPWEEVQDEAFQAVVGVVAVPLSLGDLHVGVLSHEGHDGPTASETSLWEKGTEKKITSKRLWKRDKNKAGKVKQRK